MIRKSAGIVFAVCLLCGGTVGADDRDDDHDDNVRNCIASRSQECSEDCKTSRCVSKCEKEAHDSCKVNVIATQHVFNGPVTSTPVSCPPPVPEAATTGGDGSTCSAVKGTVAN